MLLISLPVVRTLWYVVGERSSELRPAARKSLVLEGEQERYLVYRDDTLVPCKLLHEPRDSTLFPMAP
jgi:hypothetical protein